MKSIHDYYYFSLSHENCFEQRKFLENFSKATLWKYLEGWTINDNFIRKNSNNVETNTINAIIYGYIRAFKRIFNIFFIYFFFNAILTSTSQNNNKTFDRAYGANTCVPFYMNNVFICVFFFSNRSQCLASTEWNRKRKKKIDFYVKWVLDINKNKWFT